MQGHAHNHVIAKSGQLPSPCFLGSSEGSRNVYATSCERRATGVSDQVLKYCRVSLERLLVGTIAGYRRNWYYDDA
jgi:hypothetical protein